MAILFFSLLSGCAKPGVKVHGKVTLNGQPLKLRPGDTIVMVFQMLGADGQPAGNGEPASVQPDGAYTILGQRGKGFSPGRYRVVVQQVARGSNKDRLKNVFAGDNSPIICEVLPTPEVQELDIKLRQ